MLLLSNVLMVWAVALRKWVRVTALTHPLQSKEMRVAAVISSALLP